MAKDSLFDFNSYKAYLLSLVGPRQRRGGLRSAMAKALRCQSTYVSQVLYGDAHFSLEQGEALSEFLGHSRDEKHFFLLLIQKERAGTKRLESFFDEEMRELRQRRLVLTERLGAKGKLSATHQAVYYSSWHYAAIHVALTVPELRRLPDISEFFNIPKKRVATVLDFLCTSGLAARRDGEYHVGKVQTRLGNHSPEIIKHHSNWRQQAIESLERETLRDLHYSAVVSVSRADALKVKDAALQFIQESLQVIHPSQEEELFCLNIDFFDLSRKV